MALAAQKPYQGRDGRQHEPVKVALLVGTGTIAVEFDSEADALAHFGGVMPEPMDRVTIPVYVQGAWDAATQRRLPVFARYRKAASDV